MFEIRIHGRGGQGIRSCTQILGRACFLSGYHVQDFSLYGAERRGAPVVGFVRMDKKPILSRGYIHNPNFAMVIDDTVDLKNVLADCKESVLLINTAKPKTRFKRLAKKVYTIDATGLALEILGKPIENTVILGAFSKIFKKVTLKNMEKAIGMELEKDMEKNVLCAKEGFKKVG